MADVEAKLAATKEELAATEEQLAATQKALADTRTKVASVVVDLQQHSLSAEDRAKFELNLSHLRTAEQHLSKNERHLQETQEQLHELATLYRKKLIEMLRAGAAAAAVAGTGGGGPGAGAPPAQRRRLLMDSAPKLLLLSSDGNGSLWELAYSDLVLPYVDAREVVAPEAGVDARGVVELIHVWAEAALRAAVDRTRANAPAPLVVSGLVKAGKSYTLEHVVPAVMAEALRKQQQQAEDGGGEAPPLAGMLVLRLRGDQLVRSGGAMVMLKTLLRVLVRWAREEHVPLRAGALAAAEADLVQPDDGLSSGLGDAILAFLKAVEVPVLVLCDEVQSLFLPTIGGKLDAAGAEYMRDVFMKQLLVYGPRTVLWCLTGSSMVQTWVSLATMPPNGYAVITTAFNAALPATYSAAHMQWAWKRLEQQYGGPAGAPPLDPKLLELCPRSVALLTALVRAQGDYGRPSDVAAFVSSFMRDKLIEESRREWQLGMEAMPVSQRLAVLDLAFPNVGAHIDTELHPGLRRFLVPHLDKKADGRYFLRDSHQRQIVRLMFNKDGTLRDSWSELGSGASLTQLDAAWNLFYLGEAADYVLGPKASRPWQHEERPDGMDDFRAKLQAIAKDIADKLSVANAAERAQQAQQQAASSDALRQQQPGGGGAAQGSQELWERQPWFQAVLTSKYNDRDLEAYMKNREARPTDLDMLVFYLRLSRNVLGHTKPWDRDAGDILDVRVIKALPAVLGQPLFAFNDAMVEALRLLSRRTVEAAAAEFEAELPGGGGGTGSIEGSPVGGSDSAGGRGRAAKAMPVQGAPSCPGPAAAGCGQRPQLTCPITGSRSGWVNGQPRAPTIAPRLRMRLPLFVLAAAPAAVMGPRLRCW
ncbi:hypothetical protein HYH02_011947 [Chlamydomonas schloesseri]|uniref:Uncharacterized protein n=1 Tax=Chlamydomonas schloesseri TaxID=2026947 RepID=A0A835VZW7_9CHLO|nr:hypothetical protein HYH02_011947 [Chlamydomonas schloesseri]|eukprot:KAG2435447.1 hypothetical protein HYH02_011947 [Chlamydomonas schloesseri]